MIKKIKTSDLKVGMFVSDFNCGWLENPFYSSKLKISNEREVEKVLSNGIREVYIDTEQGVDVGASAEAMPREEVKRKIDEKFIKIGEAPSKRLVAIEEEIDKAKEVQKEALKVAHSFMEDSKMGKQVKMDKVDNVVSEMVDSVFRNKDALEVLGKVRSADEYTFQHSVNVSVLMVSFAKAVGIKREIITDIGRGALLHDIGKMHVPDGILNKAGKLSEEEFKTMKNHVVRSAEILKETPGISKVAMGVAAEHHERFDGTGYPKGLKGKAISASGQMASIVDVYDALTADRCYHKGMTSVEGLKKLFEWSKFHFNPSLVQQFIKAIGVFPTGSLVRTKSGYIAVVLEQGDGDLTEPILKAIIKAKTKMRVAPFIIDMANPAPKHKGDEVLNAEDPKKWKVDHMEFLDIDLT